jgi:hypothetical protein
MADVCYGPGNSSTLVMVMSQEGSINKPDEEARAVEKRINDLQVFKEPLSPVATLKYKNKKVLDEDSYIGVIWLCLY